MNPFIHITWFKEPDKLFSEGQEITPKVKPIWWNPDTQCLGVGPAFGEVVTVEYYAHVLRGKWYIKIRGYNHDFFDETCFAPVISDDELEDIMNDIDELVIRKHEI